MIEFFKYHSTKTCSAESLVGMYAVLPIYEWGMIMCPYHDWHFFLFANLFKKTMTSIYLFILHLAPLT